MHGRSQDLKQVPQVFMKFLTLMTSHEHLIW